MKTVYLEIPNYGLSNTNRALPRSQECLTRKRSLKTSSNFPRGELSRTRKQKKM